MPVSTVSTSNMPNANVRNDRSLRTNSLVKRTYRPMKKELCTRFFISSPEKRKEIDRVNNIRMLITGVKFKLNAPQRSSERAQCDRK